MGLRFVDGSNNVVDCGSGATIDNFTTNTLWMWVYPVTISAVSNRMLCSKGAVGAFRKEWTLRATGQLDMAVNGATDVAARSGAQQENIIRAGQWWFLAYTLSAALVPSIFIGSETRPVREVTSYATRITGVTLDADGTGVFRIGNAPALDACGNNIIAALGYHPLVLTPKELEVIRTHPYMPPMKSAAAWWRLGQTNTSLQADWTGNGNHGTVTGAIQAAHVPPLRPMQAYVTSLLLTTSLGGSLTGSGGIAKDARKVLAGTI